MSISQGSFEDQVKKYMYKALRILSGTRQAFAKWRLSLKPAPYLIYHTVDIEYGS